MQNQQDFAQRFESISLDARFPVRSQNIQLGESGDFEPELHLHNITEIGICREGAGIYIIAARVIPFKEGDICIIPPHQPHWSFSCQGIRSRWDFIHCDVNGLLESYCKDRAVLDLAHCYSPSFPGVIEPSRDPLLKGLYENLFEFLRQRKTCYRDGFRGCLLALLSRMKSLTTVNREGKGLQNSRELSALQPALQLIHSKYRSRVTVEEMARRCHKSPTAFRDSFRRVFACSPHEFLTRYRVSMACVELENSDKTVDTIAADNGFPTPSCFLRSFRSIHRTSPRAWAKARS